MKKSTLIFSVANLVGLALYGYFVAQQVAMKEQPDGYDSPHGNVYFLFVAAPVLMLFLLLNVIWSIVALIAFIRHREYQGVVAILVTATMWVSAIVFVKHIKIAPNYTIVPTVSRLLCVKEVSSQVVRLIF